jgi:hypothetical protein
MKWDSRYIGYFAVGVVTALLVYFLAAIIFVLYHA